MPELITRYGALRVPDIETDIIGRFLARYGEWAWLETEFIASVLPAGARVLDVGAFVGTFALGLARQHELRFLCCVEANPALHDMLEANIRHNAPCAAVVMEALVAHPSSVRHPGVTEQGNIGATNFASPAGADASGPPPAITVTLTELLARYGPLDLIKLDIEGMEREVLNADSEILSRGETALWIECNEQMGALDVAEKLLSWTDQVFYYAFPAYNPGNFNGETTMIFHWAFEAGLLAFPRTPPSLANDLAAKACILRRIDTVDALRDALWRTPRWGMPDWPATASGAEIAALAGRSLRGQSYATYLRADIPLPTGPEKTIWERLAEAEAALAQARQGADPPRPVTWLQRMFRRG